MRTMVTGAVNRMKLTDRRMQILVKLLLCLFITLLSNVIFLAFLIDFDALASMLSALLIVADSLDVAICGFCLAPLMTEAWSVPLPLVLPSSTDVLLLSMLILNMLFLIMKPFATTRTRAGTKE